jgi:stage V sporulation protein B
VAGASEQNPRRSAPPPDAPAPPGAAGESQADVARSAGRGGLAVAFAKVYFILVGLVQQIALPQIVGNDGYGALSRVLSMASIAYNPLVTGSIQGVSRAVAQSEPSDQPATVRRLFGVHLGLALLAAFGFFLLGPIVAHATGAPHVVVAIRIVSAVLFFYGLYATLIGVLNGRRQFLRQAGLDMLAATLRTIGLIGGGWWFARTYGLGVEGANAGFAAASACMLLVAVTLVGIGRRGAGGPSVRAHLVFIAPLLLGQVLLNLLLQADLQLVGYFASSAAQAAGRPLTDADPLVGAYRATQLFCFLPYQLLISVTFILFPLLAKAHKDGDRAAMARYVRTGVRLALLLAGLMVSVTSGLSGPLLRLVFPGTGYDALATVSMYVLTIGFGGFAIFGILTTVLNSLARERASMLLTGLAVALVVSTSFVLVPGTTFGPQILLRTAISTTVGLFAATLATALLVRKSAGAVAPWPSLLRVLLAMATAIFVGRVSPVSGKLSTLLFAAIVGCVYVLVLLVTRELGKQDVQLVRTVLSRRRPGAA